MPGLLNLYNPLSTVHIWFLFFNENKSSVMDTDIKKASIKETTNLNHIRAHGWNIAIVYNITPFSVIQL